MSSLLITKDGVQVEVEQIWGISGHQDTEGNQIQQEARVALLSNGAYCHGDGDLLPFEDAEEIKTLFSTVDKKTGETVIIPEYQWLLDKVLDWFEHYQEEDGSVVRKVVLSRKGYPEFEDGTPADLADIYAWFEPGDAQAAAIVGLHERRRAEAAGAKAAIPEIYQPAPPPGQPRVAGEGIAQPKPASGKGSGKPLSKAALARTRAIKAKNRAAKAKATPNPTPASQPEAAAAAAG